MEKKRKQFNGNIMMKRLREYRGTLTQQQLADKFKENGFNITNLDISRCETNEHPDFYVLQAYRTVFNTNIDYLLGLSKYNTRNEDIKMICRYTGLSENAVETLHRISLKPTNKSQESFLEMNRVIRRTLNTILDNGFNTGVLYRIGQYLNYSPYMGYVSDGKETPFIEDTGTVDSNGKPKIIHHTLSLIQENGDKEVIFPDNDIMRDMIFYKIRSSIDSIIPRKKKTSS